MTSRSLGNIMKKQCMTLENWNQAAKYVDETYTIPPSLISKFSSLNCDKDAVSLGQLASKAWLMDSLKSVQIPHRATWAMLGSWYALLVPSLIKAWDCERIYGIDSDPNHFYTSELLHDNWVQSEWRYKAVVSDCDMLMSSDMQFVTSNELIRVKPDVLINTSCEHMSNRWFATADDSQLIILQTNNQEKYQGHINTCNNMEAVQAKYPMRTVYYSGELKTPAYTRYMLVGKK